ncbi:GNAT family N-acetyltransferase [Paenibacillus pini]|uniref:Acetyltransferase n=1 Tax=Paenibacillus pini JCM 16418 TaxID=1236976 RepID=W7YUK3_9BACL|nr:GNAT family N-acetyltransferase [Paenibacillus pini]GAF06119.1 acetyltransferase [Paenibacillus pini JCM 16418]
MITLLEVNELRPAMVQELSELLIQVVENGASIGFLPPLNMEEANAYWEQVLGDSVVLWIAKHNEQIVGTVQLHLAMRANGSHRAEIAKLMVHPNARRGGIARQLLQLLENTASEMRRTLIILDTRAGDPSNLLYQSLGYIEAGRIPNFAKSANGHLDDTIFYYKEI